RPHRGGGDDHTPRRRTGAKRTSSVARGSRQGRGHRMSNVTASSLTTSLARYRRSWGLWLLLLVAPVGARYMLPIDGTGVIIAIGGHLPVMTSAFLGGSLGVVVSTLGLPIGWLFLRSNTTPPQPR